MKNIILIGMPGCGKTTIGEIVSNRLHKKFIDVDKYIEEKENKTIKEIFEKGEEYFRDLETKALIELSLSDNCVISTGGGSIKKKVNVKIMKKNGVIIFIDRPVEKIVNNVDNLSRPLLKDGIHKIYELYKERYEIYKSTCDIEIYNNGTEEEVIEKLMKIICNII